MEEASFVAEYQVDSTVSVVSRCCSVPTHERHTLGRIWKWTHVEAHNRELFISMLVIRSVLLRMKLPGMQLQGPAKGLQLARMSYENSMLRDEAMGFV